MASLNVAEQSILYYVLWFGVFFFLLVRDAARCCSFRWGADDSGVCIYGRGAIVNCVSYCRKIAEGT